MKVVREQELVGELMPEYIDRKAVWEKACRGCTRHGDNLGECYESEPCERLLAEFGMAPAVAVFPAHWTHVADGLPKEWQAENGDLINYMVFMPEYGVDIGNYMRPAKTWVCMGIPCEVTPLDAAA